jgi:hypothetical protein
MNDGGDAEQGSAQTLALILRRRHNIQTRIVQIDAAMRTLREKRDALYREDLALARAETTVRTLCWSASHD